MKEGEKNGISKEGGDPATLGEGKKLGNELAGIVAGLAGWSSSSNSQ